jgi:hypothetical protein
LKPHLIRYWLTPVVDEQSEEKIADINHLYQEAPEWMEQGEAVVSTDELTGVQALERKHETLPMKPGSVEYQEFEYKRHGTQSFIVNFMVARGKIGTVSMKPTSSIMYSVR